MTTPQRNVAISSSDFLVMSGTSASGSGYPATRIMNARSLTGRSRTSFRKRIGLGVWVSDTSHLWRAINLVASGRYPFEKLITHRFPLEDATRALEVTERKESVKAVLLPSPVSPEETSDTD